MTYRPDIDGLRAFAVLAVIFEHYGLPLFSGGYVGVDIFFVISGYLITSIILPRMMDGTFSFADFYERRCRRILPALYAMLLCFAGIPLVMPTAPFPEEFYQSLGATLLFVSNVFFGAHQGYFDAASAEKPLVHMWSLSVEEQFYVCLPLLLWMLCRWARPSLRVVLWSGWGISLLLAAVLVYGDQTRVFYWLPFRAWELLTGCLLAHATIMRTAKPAQSGACVFVGLGGLHQKGMFLKRGARHVLPALALALLVLPVVIYDSATPFPGAAALVPCVGAALYIWLGGRGEHPGVSAPCWLTRAGSWPPLVVVGLLSYALYLWHWPVWVFLQHMFTHPSSSTTGPTWLFVERGQGSLYLLARYPFVQVLAEHAVWVACGLTALLAGAFYALLEKPVRQRRILRSRGKFFAAVVVITALLGSMAWSWQQPDALAQARQRVASMLGEKPTSGAFLAARHARAETNARDIEPEDFAELGMPQINPDSEDSDAPVLVALGDSHTAMFSGLLESFFMENNLHGQQSALVRYPLLALPNYTDWGRAETPLAFAYLDGTSARHVLLSTRWVWRQSGDSPWAVARNSPALEFAAFREALLTTARSLSTRGVHLWLVMPLPEMPFDVPTTLEMTAQSGGDVRWVGMPEKDYLARAGQVRDLFNVLQAEHADFVHVIDPAAVLCRDGFCRTVDNNQSLYADDNHLSTYGVDFVRPAFAPLFSALKP